MKLDKLLNAKQMSEQLQGFYKSNTLLVKAQRGEIPCVKIGNFVKFDPAVVFKALGINPE
jgi:hypothetical protein